MAVRLFIILVLAGIAAMAANVSASTTTYPTPEEAAEAGLVELLDGGWPVVGKCDDIPQDVHSGDVCYRQWQGLGDESYRIYSVAPHGYADINWWIGIRTVEGGWIPYNGGPSHFTYLRLTDPRGNVISGYLDGDANQDGITDSLDALMILQGVAGLLEERVFLWPGDVTGGGISSHDALLILQYDAGLFQEGFPLRTGEPPFADK